MQEEVVRLLQTVKNTTLPGAYVKPNFGHVHYYMMIYAWLITGTLGLWSQLFKQYKYANYIHTVFMSIVIVITWMSGFLAILNYGLHPRIGQLHVRIGLSIMSGIILQGSLGIASWSMQKSSKINPLLVYIINLSHRILGYVMYILVALQLLIFLKKDQHEHDLFVISLVVLICSYVGFATFKFLKKNMQSYVAISDINYKHIPFIRSQKDLAYTHGNYFIFSDKVYDINQVITNHPGGYDVIGHVRGKQVDRFLYGSQPLDSVGTMKVHSHSASSIALASSPIGILYSVLPYQNMQQINEVIIHKILQPCQSKYIFTPYLALSHRQNSFIYKGYDDITQLGKYHAVTIDNKITRLYTAVNFLHQSNIKLMGLILGKSLEELQKSQSLLSSINSGEDIETDRKFDGQISVKQCTSIPLLIKKYDNGAFTRQFFGGMQGRSIKLSKARGRGLNLGQISGGNILFLTGGTGINPFCDLIDLLYKEHLISKSNVYSNQIIQNNPLVKQKLLMKKYKFTLYSSVQNVFDLHQITLYQLHQLGKNNVMVCNIRANQNSQVLDERFNGIGRIGKRFQHYLPQLLADVDNIAHIYMCGPPMMTSDLVKRMDYLNVPHHKYTIL